MLRAHPAAHGLVLALVGCGPESIGSSATAAAETTSASSSETSSETGSETGSDQPDPCAFTWRRRQALSAGLGSAFRMAPPLLEPDALLLAHNFGDSVIDTETRLVRTAKADGAVLDTVELNLFGGEDDPRGMVRPAPGELLLVHELESLSQIEVRRMTDAGQTLWSVARPDELQVTAAMLDDGELLIVDMVRLSVDDYDAQLVALDPDTGAQLWQRSIASPAVGISLDRGTDLVVDAQGRRFVGATLELEAGSFAATLLAFEPGPDPQLSWTVSLRELPGPTQMLLTLAGGPDGPLVAHGNDESGVAWLLALDPDTGAQLWAYALSELAPDLYLRDVSVSADHVIAAGSQDDRATVLVLDLDGELLCTISDEPEGLSSGFVDVELDPAGGVYLTGYEYGVDELDGEWVELLQARVDP